MNVVRREMPLLARHAGVWTGTYFYWDAEGNPVDRHRVDITVELPDQGLYPYRQLNRYTWPDGRVSETPFQCACHDKRLWFDHEKIKGSCRALDDRMMLLEFEYRHLPGSYVYETIQISDDGQSRSRSAQVFVDDRLHRLTLIHEKRVR